MHPSPKSQSLADRIGRAESYREIDELLAEGETYHFAAPITKHKWLRRAKARRSQLEDQA